MRNLRISIRKPVHVHVPVLPSSGKDDGSRWRTRHLRLPSRRGEDNGAMEEVGCIPYEPQTKQESSKVRRLALRTQAHTIISNCMFRRVVYVGSASGMLHVLVCVHADRLRLPFYSARMSWHVLCVPV